MSATITQGLSHASEQAQSAEGSLTRPSADALCPARDGDDWEVHPTTEDCRAFMEEPE